MPACRSAFSRSFLRALALLCLVSLLLPGLCGCIHGVSVSDGNETEPDPDVPAMGRPDDPPKKRVALTFDDGPQHYVERTKALVDELARYGFEATFFVVGNRIAGGDALSYAVGHGCEIGIHGYTHDPKHYYDSCTQERYEEELERTRQAILSAVPGYEVKLMRPIGGKITSARIRECPYAVIGWDVDSCDWENKYYSGISDEEADRRVNRIVENVMSAVEDGSIVLLHDIYESTYDAAVILIQRLYEEGYELVTVSELLGDALETGRAYGTLDIN
ncbi:MAG: polysaccharide deacetylase family protein [Clostridia bacterium]|nr:polysaccharide deacetylase family protein [Clostridia bacterium]